ncbi:unnamed protein product [Hydatigera taeniaeformis]|uniref:MitoNEET_N domain-containing protein n=1 Tax=Hydatigena taeniaeformis TaxID=6205 RepID=A0A0R3X3K7_HYDTA|nr:unnamed protein product [Hydatigera taeniaeformis]
MNVLHNVVRIHIPDLLAAVPIPETFSGLFSLSLRDLVRLTVFSGVFTALGYSVYFTVRNRCFYHHINEVIKKNQEKVVDFIDIESIGRKGFPLCDGTHNAHNAETGDNVGPLIIESKKHV